MRPYHRVTCGVDLTGAAIRVALVERGTAAPVLRALWSEPRSEQPLAQQLRSMLHGERAAWNELHIGLAGEHTTHRFLTLPFSSPAKLAAAVPGALAALLPFRAGEGAVAWEALRVRPEQTLVCASFARETLVRDLVAQLATADLLPTSIRPAPLGILTTIAAGIAPEESAVLVDLTERVATLAVVRDGAPVALRVLHLAPDAGDADIIQLVARETRWTLRALLPVAADAAPPSLRLFLAGPGPLVERAAGIARVIGLPALPLAQVPLAGIPSALRPAQGEFAAAIGLALRPAQTRMPAVGFRPKTSPPEVGRLAVRGELRRTRILAAAALVLLVLYAATGYAVRHHRLAGVRAALSTALVDLGAEAAPGGVDALRARVRSLLERSRREKRVSRGALVTLREVSERIDAQADLAIDTIELDPHSVRLSGRARDLATVEAVQKSLAASRLFRSVTIAKHGTAAGAVVFEIHLRASPPERPDGGPGTADA